MLKDSQLAEFHWDVMKYIEYCEKKALDGRWQKQFENASASVHISNLESIDSSAFLFIPQQSRNSERYHWSNGLTVTFARINSCSTKKSTKDFFVGCPCDI